MNRKTAGLVESSKKDARVIEWTKTLPTDKFKPVSVRYERKKNVFYCRAANLKMRSLDGRKVRIVASYA